MATLDENKARMARWMNDLRVTMGMTQVELAKKAKLSLPTVNYILNGKGSPTLRALSMLADALEHELELDLTAK